MIKGKDKKEKIKAPVVLQVLPALNHGGVETGTVEIATYLAEKGVKNFVASEGGRLVHDLEKVNVQHFTLPLNTKNFFKMKKNARALAKIIKENKINIVHARSRAPAWSAYWAAKATSVKFVTTFHGIYGLGPWGLKKLYNKVMTMGDKIIAVSNFVAKHIMQNYGISKSKIKTIYRCVSLEKFAPEKVSAERKIETMKQFAIPEDKSVLLLAGRVTRLKGHDVFIKALSQIKHKNYTALIVGSTAGKEKYVAYLKGLIKAYNLEDKVCFIDQSFDIPALIAVSDVVLSTSTQPEAFGRASIEGQAMGKIVLASNHGGSLENLVDGVTGKLFQNANPESLAQAIDWALGLSAKEKEQIGNAALENVRKNFTKEIMCDKTLDVYKSLLKK